MGFYHSVGVTARYTSPPGQRLTRPCLFRALEIVIGTHAALGLTILDEGTEKPYFARLKSIDLDQAVTFIQLSGSSEEAQQQELDQIISEYHSVRFQGLGQLPVWLVLVVEPEKHDPVRGVDVVFIFHHAIGDGAAGQAFHMALLKALDSPPASESLQVPHIVTPPALPLLGSLEALVPLPISYALLLRTLWTQVWFPRRRPPTFWSGTPIHLPSDGLKTTFRTIIFTPQTLAYLLSACRAEKTTITALLQVLIAKSLFSALPADSASHLASSIAIDLRRSIPATAAVTDETMGVFVCSLATNHARHTLTHTPLWELAREYRCALESRVRAGTRNVDTGMLKYVDDYEKHFRTLLGRCREKSFEVSNLGVFKGVRSRSGGWDVPARVVFSQSAGVAAPAVAFSVMSVKGGEMVVGVSYQDSAVEPELVARVLENLRGEVEEVVLGQR